jgi:hypothetical protein
MFGVIDDLYIILVIPTFLFSLIVQFMLKSTVSKYSRLNSSRGITGRDAAAQLLKSNQVNNVKIVAVRGSLTDYYSDGDKQIGLSEIVHSKTSITAIGVAAHEAGHAIQYAKHWAPIYIRNPIRGLSNFGSTLAPLFAGAGIFLSLPFLINIGIFLFSGAVLFSILTLPVEFNASRRALELLRSNNILTTKEEIRGARKVLTAAAMTYVAATITAIASLLRLILLSRRARYRR